eukprot:scaffold286540_cov36-Tisochrysis_lutea.AAC.2
MAKAAAQCRKRAFTTVEEDPAVALRMLCAHPPMRSIGGGLTRRKISRRRCDNCRVIGSPKLKKERTDVPVFGRHCCACPKKRDGCTASTNCGYSRRVTPSTSPGT